ncbi:cystathione beta-lyase [Tessaracoccus bendigoensis DSM 12906]|uniref:cysteine-S-conjugate beta-lyase n=1 Tax=Tessaracoccus bendigoensis DSM 12906 TaxID=1123357 RepID=A0A1M6J2Q1_9ACTN|nr:aminotransferase class I/II-fold pyridoxal phosphate-dependent enzyme [Tessaracoccus bendigoensis]SHJ40990.1 cystathione beta-lyase [Tessaracoccus bendigoensis DSM 12906]
MRNMPIFNVPLTELRERTSIKWRRFEPDVLPMFVAEMDAHIAPPIRERLERALRMGDTGYPELPIYQEAMADYANWQWGWDLDPADATLVTDVVTGMRDALEAVSSPGDAVVINPPIYPPFRGISHDRRLVEVPMVAGRLDLEGLEEAFRTQRPAAYLLCSPHNPDGTIHTRQELETVARLADAYQVAVISDEIHAPLAGARHVPYLDVDGASNAVIVISASKSFNLAALKAGLVIGDSGIRNRLRPMVSDGASYFGVLAHSAALTDGREWLAEASAEITGNKEFFAERLRATLPQLEHTPSEGTYLAWVDCAPLGLANPGQHFHRIGRVRFNFGAEFAPETASFVRVNLATSHDIIEEAVRRMAASIGAVEE